LSWELFTPPVRPGAVPYIRVVRDKTVSVGKLLATGLSLTPANRRFDIHIGKEEHAGKIKILVKADGRSCVSFSSGHAHSKDLWLAIEKMTGIHPSEGSSFVATIVTKNEANIEIFKSGKVVGA
jgi:hypothetical protein